MAFLKCSDCGERITLEMYEQGMCFFCGSSSYEDAAPAEISVNYTNDLPQKINKSSNEKTNLNNQDIGQAVSIVSKICKITSVIIFIVSFICTLFICKETYVGYYVDIEEFSFASAIPIWIGSFIFCLVLFAIGEIVSILSRIENLLAGGTVINNSKNNENE